MAQRESHEMRSMQEEAPQPNSTIPKGPNATHEPMPASRTTSMTAHEPVTRSLHTSLWVLVVFAVYAALNLLAWTVFCIASTRLAGTTQDYMHKSVYQQELESLITKHENLIKAAQIVQAITALLTIPVTSAICSIALLSFIQTGSLRTKLNLRQTMALADQGWISPRIWTRLSKVGSLPLYIAFGLTLVGAAFQIVQQSLVQTTSTQIPNSWTESWNTRVADIPGLINKGNDFRNTAIVRLRGILESTTEDEFQPYLWAQHDTDEWCYNSMTTCRYDQSDRTLDLLGSASYDKTDLRLWFTPLLSDFSSGVYAKPQYAPRMNTTVTYTNMTAGEWPSECTRDAEGVFFAEYHHQIWYYYTDLVACMPTNITSSPWNATHNRQDITEELYLNISTNGGGIAYGRGFYKATAKTTLGYFELPSAHNGYNAGPLLDEVTLPEVNGWGFDRRTRSLERRETNDTYAGNLTQSLNSNVGPLTSLALALFGEGSFIDTRLANPSAFVVAQRPEGGPVEERPYTWNDYSNNCISTLPMAYLMDNLWRSGCWTDRDSASESNIVAQVNTLISFFTAENYAQQALMVGAFLANKAWLAPDGSSRYAYGASRTIHVDQGVPTIGTSLSMAGIIAGSILLGAHLFGLLVLALYSVIKKPFVPYLGAEVMVKAGTAYAEVLGAAEGSKQWKKAAAACKGFVGDEKAGGDIGRIAFGAAAGVSRKMDRKFEGL